VLARANAEISAARDAISSGASDNAPFPHDDSTQRRMRLSQRITTGC
jgi:hypothetical protein